MTRKGFTLVELIVSLTIMGIMAGVAALALMGQRSSAHTSAGTVNALLERAAETGLPATSRTGDTGSTISHITALPDGRVLSDADSN